MFYTESVHKDQTNCKFIYYAATAIPYDRYKTATALPSMTQTDLANIVGQKSRASEILNRKRKLTLDMIRQLHQQWHIPTEVLVQAY